GDSMKVDHFLPNTKRNIDNFDGSKENLEEAKNKAALLYAECGYLDYEVEDTKEMISLFNKKEKFFKDRTDKSIEPILHRRDPCNKNKFKCRKQGQNSNR
ncbi:17902_t:CDS:2, partial [Gigaspora margarita]